MFIKVFTKAQTMPNISYKYKCCYIQNYNLPVVCLYECETWSLTLREECRPKVFENRVFRRIFRSKREDVTMEWIKLYNEELNDLYSSPNIIRARKSRRMRGPGHVACMGRGEVYAGCWWR